MDIVATTNVFLHFPYSAIATLAVSPFSQTDAEHFWRKWVEYNYNNEEGLSEFGINDWTKVARIIGTRGIYKLLKMEDVEYVILGLQLGANPSDKDSECLVRQAMHRNEDCVEELLEDGRADPSATCPEGYNIFHYATMNDWRDAVKMLLKDLRIDPTIREHKVMDYLTEYGDYEMVDILIEDGRLDITSSGCGTALENAIFYRNTEVIRSLLRDSRTQISHGDLEHAAKYGNMDTVEVLLEDGRYDPSQNNSNVLVIARDAWNNKIVQLLLKNGRVDPSVL